eukprot:TRINITY_DN2401_c0_g1_i2.p1 TRINITY_DN2401_c0_g1~~TRINITY_DN2401_c0_g1_i2.p1  ORF type:complete len:961 (+),score=198.19 TRINITY_DN2401_c0_g1_i2:101-2983(+)
MDECPPASPSYSNVGGTKTVKETALIAFESLKRRLTSDEAEDIGEKLIDVVHEDEEAFRPRLRRSKRDDGWWCHVETCREVMKYDQGKVLYAFEHGLQVTIARGDLTTRDIQECIMSAIFLEMLGCDVDFAYVHAINLTALPGSTAEQKKLGYLLCSMSLSQQDERFILLVNNIRKDLMSQDMLVVQVALTACCKLVSESSYSILAEHIWHHTSSKDVHVRTKATIALQQFYCVAGKYALSINFMEATQVFKNLINDRSSVLCNFSFCHTLVKGSSQLDGNEALQCVLTCAQRMMSGLFSPSAKHSMFVTIALLKLLVAVCTKVGEVSVGRQMPAITSILFSILNPLKRDLKQREVAVAYEVLRTMAHPSLLGFMRLPDQTKLKNMANDLVDTMLSCTNKDMYYTTIRCIGYVALVSSSDGASRKEHVFKALYSSDSSLLLAGVDVLCSIARQHNVTHVLSKLFTFARTPPHISNFAVISALRTALVARIHLLSWDVARPSSSLLHLTTTMKLFSDFSSDVHGAAEQEDEHGLKMLDWLHSELSLQEGEMVMGHGDLELCGESDVEETGEELLLARRELRTAACNKMGDILEHRAKTGRGLVCRFDPVLSRSSEPVSVRVASWALGEFAIWYGERQLNDVFNLMVDVLLDTAAGSGALALTGIVISLNKLLCMYTHLRLSGQPAFIEGRDTQLKAESLSAGKNALLERSRSRDVTVAGAAAEGLALLQLSLQSLSHEASTQEKGQATGTLELFEELSLPYSTCLQQDIDTDLKFLDSFVAEQTMRRESQGWTIKRYVKKSEREEMDPADVGNDVLNEPEREPALVKDEESLLKPSKVPWGRDGYSGKGTEDVCLSQPSSTAGSPKQCDPPVQLEKPRRKKTHAWLEEAIELANKDRKRKVKYNKVVKEAGLRGSGLRKTWGPTYPTSTTYTNMDSGEVTQETEDWRQDTTELAESDDDID